MIWRFWVQTPLGATCYEIYFVLCNESDYLIVKNLNYICAESFKGEGGSKRRDRSGKSTRGSNFQLHN